MAASPRTERIHEFGGRVPRSRFAFGAAIGVLAILAFATAGAAFWYNSPSPKARAWAGHLESPAGHPEVAPKPFTSASYTSGFNKAAVAPILPKREPQQAARSQNACPSDLNCAFRTAQSAPPQRPSTAAPPTVPVVAAPQTNPTGFAAFTSRLPAPHLLLKPFTFVADTFTGFIKKL
ncbi:MAG: hypothetical protein ACREC1_08605 [Methylovirgula sp.]